MNETDAGEAPRPRRRFGCLARLAIFVIVATAIVVGIGTLFNQGNNATLPSKSFDAGPASGFQPATVVQFEPQHLFIVRLQDETFIALYDKSPKQQELHSNCRISFDDAALTGNLPPLPGITGAFVENCDGMHAVWRADGTFAFGASYGNLDRYPTSVDASGHLNVDISTRTCTRSGGVIGIPPFVVQVCGTGD
jgi:hypothetical protein